MQPAGSLEIVHGSSPVQDAAPRINDGKVPGGAGLIAACDGCQLDRRNAVHRSSRKIGGPAIADQAAIGWGNGIDEPDNRGGRGCRQHIRDRGEGDAFLGYGRRSDV